MRFFFICAHYSSISFPQIIPYIPNLQRRASHGNADASSLYESAPYLSRHIFHFALPKGSGYITFVAFFLSERRDLCILSGPFQGKIQKKAAFVKVYLKWFLKLSIHVIPNIPIPFPYVLTHSLPSLCSLCINYHTKLFSYGAFQNNDFIFDFNCSFMNIIYDVLYFVFFVYFHILYLVIFI